MPLGTRAENTTSEVSLQASSNGVQAHWPAWRSALISVGDWDYLLGSFSMDLHGSALHLTTKRGNLGVLKTLYECDATRLEKPNADREIATFLAPRKGHWKIVQCLLNNGSAGYAI